MDWDKIRTDIDDQIDRASDIADNNLAGRIAANTRLTETQVKALFPLNSDVQALARLIAIVNSSTNENEKIQRLGSETRMLGGVIVKLIQQLV